MDVSFESAIELTVFVDESRSIRAKAYVELLDEEFEVEFDLEKTVQTDPERLTIEVENEKKRFDEVREKAELVDAPEVWDELQKLEEEEMKREMDSSLKVVGKDFEAANTCQNWLQGFKERLDEIENLLLWPSLMEEVEHKLAYAKEKSAQHATPEEQRQLLALEPELCQAVDERDLDFTRRRLEELNRLYFRIAYRDVEYLAGFLRYLAGKRDLMADQRTADHLFKQGHRAIENNDAETALDAIRELFDLLPEKQQKESQETFGYGSTVMLK